MFDRAVHDFGAFLDGKINEVEGRNKKEIEQKRLRVIHKYLPKAQGASGAAKFADPAKRST